jgi:flagellar biosynthesis protein FlhB
MASDRKTEPATPRRLRKARRAGDHPVSPALVTFGALALAFMSAPLALHALQDNARAWLVEAVAGATPNPSELARRIGMLAGPPLGAAALGALIAGLAQTRGVLSLEPLRGSFERLNPVARPRRSFGAHVFTISLALTGALVLSVAAGFMIRDMGAELAHGVGDVRAASSLTAESCRRLGSWALGVALAIAGADAVFRYVEWLGRHRMTPDEVRRERREDQGDPELAQARQRVHRELANSGAAREIAQANLLVLGAPRLAVALRYDPHRDVAPRVVLRGAGAVAASLEALAASHGVPIEHDTALARQLASVPLDQEIPKSRYADIARALQRAGMFRPP